MYEPINATIEIMYQRAPKATILLFIYRGYPMKQVEQIINKLLNIMGIRAYLKVNESFSCIRIMRLIPIPNTYP
mgnify:CR=1 FL=1